MKNYNLTKERLESLIAARRALYENCKRSKRTWWGYPWLTPEEVSEYNRLTRAIENAKINLNQIKMRELNN